MSGRVFGFLNKNLLDGICLNDKRRIEEKRMEEWLNEDGATRTLTRGYTYFAMALASSSSYNQMIIQHGNLLNCICLDNKRRVKEN
jgi:hypothetical protein